MATKYGLRYVEFASMNGESSTLGRYVIPSSAMARAGARVSAYGEVANYDKMFIKVVGLDSCKLSASAVRVFHVPKLTSFDNVLMYVCVYVCVYVCLRDRTAIKTVCCWL